MRRPRIFCIGKEAGRRNEDAFGFRVSAARFVISDGASTSFAAREWAWTLCQQYIRDPDVRPEWLEAARIQFADRLKDVVQDWSAAMAYERGSFAALLAFRLESGRVIVHAIGDSVLFLKPPSGDIDWFPRLNAETFAQDPVLLSSHRLRGAFDETEESFANCHFEFPLSLNDLPRTQLVAVTDAIAAWVIGEGDPANRLCTLLQIGTAAEFRDLVHRERISKRMRRDDCTLLVVRP